MVQGYIKKRLNDIATIIQRQYQLEDLPGIDIESLDSKTICELLLFGSPNVNVIVNRIILEATISFIKSTQRLG